VFEMAMDANKEKNAKDEMHIQIQNPRYLKFAFA
jgi:hypothetical protein